MSKIEREKEVKNIDIFFVIRQPGNLKKTHSFLHLPFKVNLAFSSTKILSLFYCFISVIKLNNDYF